MSWHKGVFDKDDIMGDIMDKHEKLIELHDPNLTSKDFNIEFNKLMECFQRMKTVRDLYNKFYMKNFTDENPKQDEADRALKLLQDAGLNCEVSLDFNYTIRVEDSTLLYVTSRKWKKPRTSSYIVDDDNFTQIISYFQGLKS